MTERVDFYVLDAEDSRQRWVIACRLAEKAYLRELRAVLLANSAGDARALDQLLWTFSDRSFVPHDRFEERLAAESAAPVHLSADAASAPPADVLVNVSDRLPEGFERYRRVAEVIDGEPRRRELARARFKAYRELNLAVETHPLRDGAEP